MIVTFIEQIRNFSKIWIESCLRNMKSLITLVLFRLRILETIEKMYENESHISQY